MSKESSEVKNGIQRQSWSLRARSFVESKCGRCEAIESIGKRKALEVHHMDGDWTNNDLSNLETLCKRCHNTHHFKMEQPICSRDGCAKRAVAKDFCRNHYQAEWRRKDKKRNPERYKEYTRRQMERRSELALGAAP